MYIKDEKVYRMQLQTVEIYLEKKFKPNSYDII